jgi:hypothetical protein
MRIEIWIDYWEEGVLSFNPEKVLIQLRKYFPQVEIDWTDQSRVSLERFFEIAHEKGLTPPPMIVEKHWELFSQNTPTFKFKFLTGTNTEITGLSSRWRIEFELERKVDSETEKTIIDFLKSLNYGEIRSNARTEYFCQPHKDFKDYWLLEESV